MAIPGGGTLRYGTPPTNDNEQYSKEEAQRRFVAAVVVLIRSW